MGPGQNLSTSFKYHYRKLQCCRKMSSSMTNMFKIATRMKQELHLVIISVPNDLLFHAESDEFVNFGIM